MNWKDVAGAIFCLGGLNPLCLAGCGAAVPDVRREDGTMEVNATSQISDKEALDLARQKANAICDDQIAERNYTLDTYEENVAYVLVPKYKETCRPHRYRSGEICRDRQIGYLVDGWRAYFRFKCV